MKRNIVIATLTAAVLVGGGSAVAFANGDDDAPAQKDPKAAAQNASTDDDRDDRGDDRHDEAARSAKVTVTQAVDAALKAQPGTAVAADLDSDDGTRAWEVDILGKGTSTYTVRVDADNGKVLGTETDNEQDDAAEWRTALKDTRLDLKQAAEAVADKGSVVSVDLDDDATHNEGWQLETITAPGHEENDWNVDPKSGKVTADQDHDDNHDDEDQGQDD